MPRSHFLPIFFRLFKNVMNVKKSTPRKLHPQLQKLDKKLKHAAQMYEKQFLRQMVKAMRNSVSHSSLTKPGMAENIYREQLDERTVENWVNGGGTGFSDVIYNDLVEKFYPMLKGPRKPKIIRPTSISDRFQGVSRTKIDPKQKSQNFQIEIGAKKKPGQSYLQIPWNAKFEKAFQLNGESQVAEFSHPNGLKSTFVFKGQVEPGLLNKSLVEGENFAQLGPETQMVTWQIQDANSRKDSSEVENKGFN